MHPYDQKFVSGHFYMPHTAGYQPYEVPLSPGSRRPELVVPTVPIVEPEVDTSDRQVTDPGPRATYYIMLFVAVIIALLASIRGAPAQLYRGVNFNGLICGVDAPVLDMPFVYYPLSGSGKRAELLIDEPQCVVSCPGVKDVGRTLDVPMSQLERDPASGSSVVVQYRVHTPVYATRQIADYLCLPLDESLKSKVLGLHQGFRRQLIFGLGTSQNAWPAIVVAVVCCLIGGGAISALVLKNVPWVAPIIAAPAWPLVLLAAGSYALWFSAGVNVSSIYQK